MWDITSISHIVLHQIKWSLATATIYMCQKLYFVAVNISTFGLKLCAKAKIWKKNIPLSCSDSSGAVDDFAPVLMEKVIKDITKIMKIKCFSISWKCFRCLPAYFEAASHSPEKLQVLWKYMVPKRASL